ATGAVSNLPQGALIRSVTPGGAAAEAGLGPGDVVTAVDGVAVDADHPFDAVALGLDPGQRVRLTVISRGKARSADIVVARAASGNGETAP
ncbi:MAG TPA: PDZ domain-containing protein, partial [Candidatus Sulfotelmatobacter sp.]|nr:PDZ domain-containing protein [Candidatus Sulfotelmatobacter sp.]